MRIRVGGRASGKTTEMLRLAMETPDAIWVVGTAAEALNIERMVRQDYGPLRKLRIVVAHALRSPNLDGLEGRLFIDNADLILRRWTHLPIAMVTMTDEDWPNG